MTFIGFQAINLLPAVAGGFWRILYVTVPFAVVHIRLILYTFSRKPAGLTGSDLQTSA